MGKKKREHIVFDQMLIPKKNIPFVRINSKTILNKKAKATKSV